MSTTEADDAAFAAAVAAMESQEPTVDDTAVETAAEPIVESAASHYTLVPKGCVKGKNISLIPNKTVEECAALCDADDKCLAFEYGVSYGGSHTKFKPGDCHQQSGNNPAGCDGGYYNLDLYIKH